MKLSQIALAVASLSVVPAFAATGSLQTLYGVTPANTVYVSGASALSSSFANVVGANCTGGSGNVVSFTINGSTSDGRVTVCTTSSTDGQFAGPFAVVKRDTNGSFDGVGPVIDQAALTKWADVNNCNDATLQCGLDSTTAIVPHAGLTDVDTNVWVGMANTGALSIPVTDPSTTGTVLNGGFAGQGFGVMVSESLYDAMMAKQVAEGRLPVSAGGVSCVAGNYTPGACQPSISKEEYAAIVDSQNFAYVANGALSGDAGVINLCRRVETSGTQASSNVYFLNNSCGNASPTVGFKNPKAVDFSGGGVNPVAFNSSSGDAVTGNYDDFGGAFGLFEGSGTGDARNCVIRRNGGKNPNNVADGLGTYAAGWISLENAPAAGWKLVKLDGVSPNAVQVAVASDTDGNADGWMADTNQRTNVVKGYYDAAPELEMLWPSTTPYGTFLTSLKNTFANPALVSLRGVFQANGVFTHAGNETKVHKGTRNGNFCAPQALAE
ncbi:MAG: hypothetical protein KKA22_03645 [Gammaproteobacteria bacterium]|nr:hypothetical protein [Gammaproteobacteria bacterium]MBU1407224.1 hypothetical protein [Gammaproteobacteria bacterium]MBU1531402.1 hypothetical protein [Gammaproteobacteria bacterium]